MFTKCGNLAHPSYHEVTTRRRFPVNDTEHGTHVLKGPLSYYAAAYGRGGRDFRLDSDLMSGTCFVGGSFGSPEFLLPVDMKHNATMKKAKAEDVCGGAEW